MAMSETDAAQLEKQAGQKYGHYTPDTKVVLVEGESKSVSEKIVELLENYRSREEKVGLLLSEEIADLFAFKRTGSQMNVFCWGPGKSQKSLPENFLKGSGIWTEKGWMLSWLTALSAAQGLGMPSLTD